MTATLPATPPATTTADPGPGYPPIDPHEPVPDDPGELSPDTPDTLPPAPAEPAPEDPDGPAPEPAVLESLDHSAQRNSHSS